MEEKPKSRGVLNKVVGFFQETKPGQLTSRDPGKSSAAAKPSQAADAAKAAALSPAASKSSSRIEPDRPKQGVPQPAEMDDFDLDFTGMSWEAEPSKPASRGDESKGTQTLVQGQPSAQPDSNPIPGTSGLPEAKTTELAPILLEAVVPNNAETIAAPLAVPSASSVSSTGDLPPIEFALDDTPALALPDAPPEPQLLEFPAMRFAEGEIEQTDSMLLALWSDLLGQGEASGNITPSEEAEAVAFALFDLYRATGNHDAFDKIAMAYVEHYGRSPAEWFDVPKLLLQRSQASKRAAKRHDSGASVGWTCPVALGSKAISMLSARYSAKQITWQVQWEALQRIEDEAAEALSGLVRFWLSHPVHLQFSGVDALLSAIAAHTTPENAPAARSWWLVRMDLLCILRRVNEFEDVALEYCQIYEVSPPSWIEAKCSCELETQAEEANPAWAESDFAISEFSAMEMARLARFELEGELLDKDMAPLERLRRLTAASQAVRVDCHLLVRIDFIAAGALLNWASEREAAGCTVEFVNVPRLIASYFQILGILQHAKVMVRNR